MEYLLVMSLSGSTMMGLYFLLKVLLKDKVSARLYYLISKEAVLFFLIPLPFLKEWYRKVILAFLPKEPMKSVQIQVAWTKLVIHMGEKKYVNAYTVVQMTVAVVWLFIACILMMSLFLKYVQIRRLILKYQGTEMTEKQRSFLAELKKQYGVKRSVILCQGHDKHHAMTFGVCRPVIICNKEMENPETAIYIRREMVHIKRMDALWKMFARFVVILHWWNPVAWILRHDFERICEYSCDEIVMQGKTSEEVKAYLRLLIEEAHAVSETEPISMGWQNNFADDVKNMKKRISNLMKPKKWNSYAAMTLAAVLAFVNSMTVFAYRDTFHQEVAENTSQDKVIESLRADNLTFTPNGTEIKDFELMQEIEILYEKQFIDAEGNIYPYSDKETMTIDRSCSHDFVSGTITVHTKNSDGSCKISMYHAQRCSKCSYVISGEEINVVTYKVCPH